MSERTVDSAGRSAASEPPGRTDSSEEADVRGRFVPAWAADAIGPAAIGFGTTAALVPFGARLARNAPVTLPVDLATHYETLAALGLVGPAVAATVLGLCADDPLSRIGLLFVGIFGVLATVAPAAWLPAAVAIPAGGGVVALAALPRSRDPRALGTWLAVALVLAGVLISLASAVGLRPALWRPVGAHAALLGAALVPVWVLTRPLDWTVGGLAVAGVLVAAASAPFVLGAVLLVAGGVVGTSVAVVALALGGLAVATSAALRGRRYRVLAGVALLLAAGAPATLPRATAAVLGVVVLAEATRTAGGVPT